MFKLTCCIMYTSGVGSLKWGAYRKVERMNAIAAEWNTADATRADGPRGASGCMVKSVMVREDLIRPVNPSLFGLPDSHCTRGTVSVSGEVLLMGSP